MKKNKFLTFIIVCISLFIISGCGKSEDNENIPSYSQNELYQKYKEAYKNRKIYDSDYTEKETYLLDDANSNDDYSSFYELSYNGETKEGYYKSKFDGNSLTENYNLNKEEIYIIKNEEMYLNYYSSNSIYEDYIDVFVVDDNYFNENVKKGKTEQYIGAKNPSQYTTIDTYSNSLIKSILKTDDSLDIYSYIDQNGYEYTLMIMFDNLDGNPYFIGSIEIIYNDYTINEISIDIENKFYNNDTLECTNKHTFSYKKEYGSSNMISDFSKFNGIEAGESLNVEFEVVDGILSVSNNILVKKNQNILNRMEKISEKCIENNEEKSVHGWFYDEDFTIPVEENDTFSKDITLYGKIDTKLYNINQGNKIHGNFSVINKASLNDTVYVNAYANSGYVISEMYYIEEGASVKNYFVDSFKMPKKNITVYVVFDTSIHIHTKEELVTHLQDYSNWSKNFTLYEDIDLKGMEWTPVGNENIGYSGVFDGNGKTISNFKITQEKKALGFFGTINKGTIKKLKITNYTLVNNYSDDDSFSGGLVGYIEGGNIINCASIGNVNVSNSSKQVFAGGLSGVAKESNINNSYANGSVEVYSHDNAISGILIGYIESSEIKNSYSTGEIYVESGTKLSYAGGIIGSTQHSVIQSCYSTANVTSKRNDYAKYAVGAGGLIALVSEGNTIKNSYSTGDVLAKEDSGTPYAGGLFAIITQTGEQIIVTNNHKHNKQNVTGTLYTDSGINASKESIWLFVYNTWDNSVWNLYTNSNPTLK